MWINRKYRRAHRISFLLHRGPIPDGLCVLHHCDVPSCVNPDHLFVGTRRDNMADCFAKARHAHGETHHKAKLTRKSVSGIRASKEAAKVLAIQHGVTTRTIYDIRHGRSWRGVS